VSDLTSGRPLVKPFPSKAPCGRPAPPDIKPLITEVAALAGLLAQVVEMAGKAATFPATGKPLVEQAMGHHSVRAALLAAEGDAS
jgi:hypothetical protein